MHSNCRKSIKVSAVVWLIVVLLFLVEIVSAFTQNKSSCQTTAKPRKIQSWARNDRFESIKGKKVKTGFSNIIK